MTLKKRIRLGWKYRRVLWKYRKLLRHRKQLTWLALTGAAGAAVAGAFLLPHRAK